jgi:DNA replication initiation complex subunit (GINS family)
VYDVLYDAWLKEKAQRKLQDLPKSFYGNLAEYIHQIKREGRMLDRKSAKAKLTARELENVKRLTEELITLRFQKIVTHITSEKSLKKEALTSEEEKVLQGLRSPLEEFRVFLKDSLRGKAVKVEEGEKPSGRKVLRFLKEVPAVVGMDLQVYGPFSIEDVATLPVENAKVFIKQGIAMEIDAR